jgi:outer membrane protein W
LPGEPLSGVWRHCSRLIILIAALAVSVVAQQDAATRSVEGRVLDQSGQVVVGAVVQIKDMKTLQIRSFITQEVGVYHFAGLSPNADYEVTASKEGIISRVKTLRSYSSKKKVVMDLVLR